MITTEDIAPAALPKLTNEEIARYSRHLILPEVGMEGQQKLKAAKVLCVGTPLRVSGRSALSISMSSMRAICSARSFTRSPPSASSRWTPPRSCSRASTRTSTW
jgi:hypothetical protein